MISIGAPLSGRPDRHLGRESSLKPKLLRVILNSCYHASMGAA